MPKNTDKKDKIPTLYMNDGQDFDKLAPRAMYKRFFEEYERTFIWVAIHTNHKRLQEYGTSYIPDYKGRGALATDYMNFIILELMPHIQNTSQSSTYSEDNYFCGFSLGGLSAFDIVWENPHLFSRAGVFSGSFWWRNKGYEEGFDEDDDLIMVNKIKDGYHKKGLKFWLECGTNDEAEDRNNNGIIDSIDDTMHVIEELENKGYTHEDITYIEIQGGEHNFNTWKAVFYDFMEWAFVN